MLDSLRFRIVLAGLIGTVTASLISLLALSAFLTRDLLDRVDQNLKTNVLEVASSMAKLGDTPDSETISQELERYGHMHGIGQSYFRMTAKSGKPIAQSNMELWPLMAGSVAPLTDVDAQIFTFATHQTEAHPQGIRVIFYRDPQGRIIEIGTDLGETKMVLSRARLIILFSFLGIVFIGGALGWLLTGRSLRGVSQVSHAAQRFTDELDFSLRVKTPTGSRETDQLATAFNTMIGQMAALVQSQKGIMNNIAHDIRSPVARMRAAAEARIENGAVSEIAGRVIEECDHILNLVNLLLEISETEAGTQTWHVEPVDCSQLVEQALELFQPVIEEAELEAECHVAGDCSITADPRVVQRLIANLIDNAVKFTDVGGRLSVSITGGSDAVRFHIQDTGRGIAPEDLPHVFDRFFRGDASRSTPGNGLGLSFCAAVVQAMGGTISCDSELGRGTRFDIALPREAKRQIQPPPF